MKSGKKNNIESTAIKKTPKLFYVVMVLIPILFFIILEILLRSFGYGLDYTQFKTISSYYPDKLFLNPDLPYKYFYNVNEAPSVLPDGFDKVKKENAFRVFVLGGSSAAGWPYVPNASFSRHLKRRLELLYPENTIEVINLGVSAINSYTIRDFIPEVLNEKPDLILIYAGHNEYYGALGVGSTVSMGTSRYLINTYIRMKSFKTTELVQDLISGIYGLFSQSKINSGQEENETLMSRMIGESTIPYQSGLYLKGIEQFDGNLKDIFKLCKEGNVPVIIGTLTSNTLDQKPFISEKFEDFPPANEIYNEGLEKLNNGEFKNADSLLTYAKDLDALRFRAPSEINKIIKRLAVEFNYPVVNVDSVFRSESELNIVGYNLTVDHLHPNIKGYSRMARSYYLKMEELNILPMGKRNNISLTEQDSLLKKYFPFTKLDSTLSEMKIIILTGNYPFVPKGTPNYEMKNYKMKSIIDTISMKIINKEIKWETAHTDLADWYFGQGNYEAFRKEMDAIIQERPFFDQPYEYLIRKLVDKELVNEASPYLLKLHSFKPGYYTNKWLGQINLYKENYKEALNYLIKAVEFPEADYQTWYNLAGAYYHNGQTQNAIFSIKKSLGLNPDNPRAKDFYQQLSSLKY